MTPFSPIRLVGGNVPLLPTVFPPYRPYTGALFSEEERRRLLDHITHHLWLYAGDPSAPSCYTLAKTIVWNVLQSYETQTNTMPLEVCRLLIKQTENFLWGLPDPFRDEESAALWSEDHCTQYAERIMNGLLQTVRPMYFVTIRKGGQIR